MQANCFLESGSFNYLRLGVLKRTEGKLQLREESPVAPKGSLFAILFPKRDHRRGDPYRHFDILGFSGVRPPLWTRLRGKA